MFARIIKVGVVVALALALVGGTAYLLLRPDEALGAYAEQNEEGGARRGRSETGLTDDVSGAGRGGGSRVDREVGGANGKPVDDRGASSLSGQGHSDGAPSLSGQRHSDGAESGNGSGYQGGEAGERSTGLGRGAGYGTGGGGDRAEPTEVLPASSDPIACPICEMDWAQYSGPLSQQEVDGLLKALNDEYHAWAVYDRVIEDFGQTRPFVNIQQAEAKHVDELLALFRSYQVPIPENPWPGDVPGFDSAQDACAEGVAAEIANAALYDDLFASTDREDILDVYQALQRASQEQHLPAFQRCAVR